MDEFRFYFTTYLTYILSLLLIFVLLRFIFVSSFKSYHSRWNTVIDKFSFSSKEFYELLRKELLSNGINNLDVKFVFLKEGNAFSSRRTYLRAVWKDYQYDICAAPFGNGFFVSWWLLYKNSIGLIIISKIPFIGKWLAEKLYPITYYKIDTASMFMTYAQASVLKVIEDITNDKGVRSLSESERKPVLNNIFSR